MGYDISIMHIHPIYANASLISYKRKTEAAKRFNVGRTTILSG